MDPTETQGFRHSVVEGVEDIIDLARLSDASVVKRLDAWEQGHLVSGLRLFWATSRTFDNLAMEQTESPIDGGWDVQRLAHDRDSVPGSDGPGENPSDTSVLAWGVITSQSCDVAATGPGKNHPTIQISPLVRLNESDEKLIADVKSGKRLGLVHVPKVPNDGTWAADLRISLPVSKAVLLEENQVPLSGFASGQEVMEFSEQVAAKTRRPAVHDYISGAFLKDLREFVKRQIAANVQWIDLVEQFRILFPKGEPLRPESVCLLVLVDEKFSAPERNPLREWRKSKRSEVRDNVPGATLEAVRFRLVGEMLVREYRDSFPLYVPELGRPAYW